MAHIRPCTPADIPQVADLFQTVFRKSRSPAPASLQAHLHDVFFSTPWHDPELPSLVYGTPSGTVEGFMGVIPLNMALRGKPIRAALGSSIMVRDPAGNPLAGAALLRAFFNGPQDLSMSDDANQISVAMWKKLGAQSIPLESMDWLRVLRPAGFALAMLAGRVHLARLASPICAAIDVGLARLASNRFRIDAPAASTAVEVDRHDRALIGQLEDSAAAYSLGPRWDANSVHWLLDQAAQQTGRGDLACRMVYGRHQRPLGCYLYHGRPGAVAFVLQVVASASAAGSVLDCLLHEVRRNGCVAVRGRAHGRYFDELFRRDCIFFNRGTVLAHSRHTDVMDAARSGDVLMTGLAGEAWTRLAAGDAFA